MNGVTKVPDQSESASKMYNFRFKATLKLHFKYFPLFSMFFSSVDFSGVLSFTSRLH